MVNERWMLLPIQWKIVRYRKIYDKISVIFKISRSQIVLTCIEFIFMYVKVIEIIIKCRLSIEYTS